MIRREEGDVESGEEEFERRLTEAMRRSDAPADLAQQVMARAQAQRGLVQRLRAWLRLEPPEAPGAASGVRTRAVPAWTAGVLAAAALAVVVTGAEREHIERERAAMTERQYQAAMEITDRTLEHARQQLQRSGIELGQ